MQPAHKLTRPGPDLSTDGDASLGGFEDGDRVDSGRGFGDLDRMLRAVGGGQGPRGVIAVRCQPTSAHAVGAHVRRVLEAQGREVLVVDGRAVDDPFREAVVRATGRTRACAAPDPVQAARDLVAGLGERALVVIETERRAWGTAIASELLRTGQRDERPSCIVWLAPTFSGVDVAEPFDVPGTLGDDDLDLWWRAAGSEAAAFARRQRRSPAAPWVASDKLEDAERWFASALALPSQSAPAAPEMSGGAARLLTALVLARRAWPSADLAALLCSRTTSSVGSPSTTAPGFLRSVPQHAWSGDLASQTASFRPSRGPVTASHRQELDELLALDLVAVDAWGDVVPTSRAIELESVPTSFPEDSGSGDDVRRAVAVALEQRGGPRPAAHVPERDDGPASAAAERDPWSLSRAAELYAELGDVDAAERAAHAALASLADAPARDDLWSRWIHCLESTSLALAGERAPRLVRSSELALRVGHVDIALRLARDAAAAAPGDYATMLAMGRALAARGDLVGAGVALERAREIASDDARRCAACVELAEVRYGTGDLEGAESWAQQALELGAAGAADRASSRIAARNVLGKVLLARGAWTEAEVHFATDAIEATCANDRVAELRAKTNRAIALLSNGRLDEARQMLLSVHDVGETRGELRAVTFALTNLATIATLQHRYADALDLSERAFHAYRRLGERVRLAPLATNLAELRLRLGLVDEAEHGLKFGMKACGRDLPAMRLAHFSFVSAQIQLARGRTQAAGTELAAALAGMKTPDGSRSWGGPAGLLLSQCHRLGARVALEDGDVARAAKILDQARKEPPSIYARAEIAILDAAVAQASGAPFVEAAASALELAREADDVELLVEAHALLAEAHLAEAPLTSDGVARASSAVRAARVVRDEIATSLPQALRAAYLARRHAPDLDRLESRVERALRDTRSSAPPPASDEVVTVPPPAALPVEVRALKLSAAGTAAFARIVGHDPAIRSLLAAIPKVAASDATILVHGESGTGKELVAEAIHASSPRAAGPLVKVNCAALVETLLLSELFGHEKGAFTGAAGRRRGRFEAAEGGTLFLDEIGDISARTQVALLRVLQDKTFERVGGTTQVRANCRIVCATHRDLRAMVARGEFREDLYYRLRGVVLEVPSLRQRIGDLPVIAASLLERVAQERHEPVKHLSPRANAALSRHAWPGNIRELENALRAAALFADGDVIELEDLTANVQGLKDLADGLLANGAEMPLAPPTLRTAAVAAAEIPGGGAVANGPAVPAASAPQATEIAYSAVRGGISLGDMKRRIERECISRALGESDGNITRAASLLGMKRPRLSQLVKQYGLQAGSEGGLDRDAGDREDGTTDESDSLDPEEV